jgi:thymidylate synthase
MSTGFPILTTKRVSVKSVLGELLWFLEGSTSAKVLRDKYKTTIWDEWQNKDGYLGKIYSQQWVRWETPYDTSIIEVKIKNINGVNKPYEIFNNELIENIDNKKIGDLSKKIFESNRSGKYRVLDIVDVKNGNSVYNVQFLDTKFITQATAPNIKSCTVNDKYKKNIYNEGCIGNNDYRPDYYKKAYDVWYNMMSRCYNTENDNYVFYGKKNIYVDQRWRCFSNFLEDITQVPYFEYWRKSPELYDLDKDYYLAKYYSKETCVFLYKDYNRHLNDGTFAYKGIKDNGFEEIFISQKDFAEKYSLDRRRISDCINNKLKKHKNWRFEKIYAKKGYVFRKKIIINQIDNIIEQLRNNPDSRRILLSSWNVSDLDLMNLLPCHYGFQCYSIEMNKAERYHKWIEYQKIHHLEDTGMSVENAMQHYNFPTRKLSLKWVQRSADFFIGIPFNITSYAFLLCMLAEVTNHIPNELIGDLGDVHLYNNHLNYVDEQLKRIPKQLPILKIKRKVTDIYDFKYEDFELENYNPEPNWKNVPIAV